MPVAFHLKVIRIYSKSASLCDWESELDEAKLSRQGNRLLNVLFTNGTVIYIVLKGSAAGFREAGKEWNSTMLLDIIACETE